MTLTFHAYYLGIIALIVCGGWFGVHEFLQEHDQRLAMQQAAKVAEAQVSDLQSQIAQRDKQAAQQAAPIVKIIHDVQTVPQAIAALPQVVNVPLPVPVVAQPNNSVLIPEPDVLPLFAQVADDKVCNINLATAKKDLVDTQQIVTDRNTEIVALKKKPSVWKRVTTTAKWIGIGIGIGALGVALHK